MFKFLKNFILVINHFAKQIEEKNRQEKYYNSPEYKKIREEKMKEFIERRAKRQLKSNQ